MYITFTSIPLPHTQLPAPFDRYASAVLLEGVPDADTYLGYVIVALICIAIIQVRAFIKPKPIPLKELPRRPAFSILFKPDEVASTKTASSAHAPAASIASDVIRSVFSVNSSTGKEKTHDRKISFGDLLAEGFELQVDSQGHERSASCSSQFQSQPIETPLVHDYDLPDSFAPLLSSSQTEMLMHQMTVDLIHGVHVEGEIKIREGRHEIPLDKDASRPQLVFNVPKGGLRLAVVADVGSDGFSKDQDLDPTIATRKRSCPMVKHAGVVCDPPLPLRNVAPTLIHFPTLFEDNNVPKLRRIQIFRFTMDLILSFSSFIEKILWILEGYLHIHLAKVRIVPVYKGKSSTMSSEWRLSLSFSGHCLLFGWILIPFINIVLPTFIIPQPHALLQYLATKQPLASAQLKRENIDETHIFKAITDLIQSFSGEVKAVATPPAVGVDLTLPGGVSLGLELIHGRDVSAGRNRKEHVGLAQDKSTAGRSKPFTGDTGASLSSWTTNKTSSMPPEFDANDSVPWTLNARVKGTVSHEKLTFHLSNFEVEHDDSPSKSFFNTKGSFSIWKAQPELKPDAASRSTIVRRSTSFVHRVALGHAEAEQPSVAAMLFFLNESQVLGLLQYDYAFDIADNSKLDAVTISAGAHHPMLNGGSIVTVILESMYMHGSISARENAILDPIERRRKRNVLRHLPAIDITAGVQNCYIPPDSLSFTDDGQTRSLPKMEGGRAMVRIVGGITQQNEGTSNNHTGNDASVAKGIKILADFACSSLVIDSATNVKEFPELEIFEGATLCSYSACSLGGKMSLHLRPQRRNILSTTGPNIFNPLEAYEIDFSGSSLSLRIKEASTNLGHRRIIFPTETKIGLKIVESVVDMTMEGKTECELSWDFQGLSPMLQVSDVGASPADVSHEQKKQVPLLIAPLRQGRFKLHISPVGGINITKAVTSREDKEGLFDWKFFNALVSPDATSMSRLIDIVQDRRTMDKLLQVVKLINGDIHRGFQYMLTQFWRGKVIFDQEGVTDASHAISGNKMARLLSLFLCGNISQADAVFPMIRRVVAGDGLDVVKAKEMLRMHCDFYDDWAPEIDRGFRFLEAMFLPITIPQPYVENQVVPLSERPIHIIKFRSIPSAQHLYDQIQERPHLPLGQNFSNMISHVAPYLTIDQVEFMLKTRPSKDWQPSDLKRLRYVFAIKRKVQDIAESYGGLSFLPQSFLVSVFLGEATRTSLRVSKTTNVQHQSAKKQSTLSSLRQRRATLEEADEVLTPAGRVHSPQELDPPASVITDDSSEYELSDCLLGPPDVAVLLQAGLTSVMKNSSVVQLNQRMLLDLIASQPTSFAVAVLAEIGTPGGQGSPRGLTSALMSLLELDQSCFRPTHRLNMHALLESWLPGLHVPQREDYMAGGRWARQSYYSALYALAASILEDAECYMALKGHLQRVRHANETDAIPCPKEEQQGEVHMGGFVSEKSSKLDSATAAAKAAISRADRSGKEIVYRLRQNETTVKSSTEYKKCIELYHVAFDACARVLALDRMAFQTVWFKAFYNRNYDALMIKSMMDNVYSDTDSVRYWLQSLRRGAKYGAPKLSKGNSFNDWWVELSKDLDKLFLEPEKTEEQVLVDAVIDATIFLESDRERLRDDPLVRLLISNKPGKYDFTIVTAMGVITEGKAGLELHTALERIRKKRGVLHIRADTATARSFEYNASKIIEAIQNAHGLGRPFGTLGYSQGCANVLMAESTMLSGTPSQRNQISDPKTGLICRQLLFSAANSSRHGPASDKKAQRLIIMWEEMLKYQQGYFSKAFQSTFLEGLNSMVDSASFQKAIGGAQSMLPDGARAFWREAQHLQLPTCTLRGVLEAHTTPEALEMVSNMLTKQSGSSLHDSQVHAYDAVGHPVYHKNRNGKILEKCDVGQAAIQRTHHWSPLNSEVEFIATPRDSEMASFDCAKDRHIFPWVDVNVRFGIIKYSKNENDVGLDM